VSDTDSRGLQLKVQELAFLLEKFRSSKPVSRKGCDKKNQLIYPNIQMTNLLGNFVLIGTFIGPSKPFKLPRKNRVDTAIQKLVLRPNSVLKMILKSSIHHQCSNGKNI
jgi:hypothetical protein